MGGGLSGFVTDDGKDLDERYLGINAKAKSAESADSVDVEFVVANVTVSESSWVSIDKTISGGDTVTTTYEVPQTGFSQFTITGSSINHISGSLSGNIKRNGQVLFTFSGYDEISQDYGVSRIDHAGTLYEISFKNASCGANKIYINGTILPLALIGVSKDE